MIPSRHRPAARRITVVLFAAQSLGSAGFVAALTVNSIVGAKLSGHPTWAGVPTAVYQLGVALAAFAWGYAMDRLGWRGGLALGLCLGVAGAALAVHATIAVSFAMLLGGLVLIGAANSAMQLSRFAAAEVYPPPERGRAISNVVIGGTVGAVLGPLLVGPTGSWAQQAGLDELAGPFVAAMVLLLITAAVVFVFLRPDPRDIGRELAGLGGDGRPRPGPARRPAATRSIPALLREPGVIVAMTAMVLGQACMVMLMVITSLHMKDHQHSLADISLVISSHVFGMFAFSIISGRLADRWGRGPVIVLGSGVLVLACLTAPLSPGVLPLGVALFLLGLGWNFCFVGGSSLLADQLSPAERTITQGFNDLLIGLASAGGSFGSGLVFAALGYGMMGVVGAAVALVPLGLTLWWQVNRRVPTLAH